MQMLKDHLVQTQKNANKAEYILKWGEKSLEVWIKYQ